MFTFTFNLLFGDFLLSAVIFNPFSAQNKQPFELFLSVCLFSRIVNETNQVSAGHTQSSANSRSLRALARWTARSAISFPVAAILLVSTKDP